MTSTVPSSSLPITVSQKSFVTLYEKYSILIIYRHSGVDGSSSSLMSWSIMQSSMEVQKMISIPVWSMQDSLKHENSGSHSRFMIQEMGKILEISRICLSLWIRILVISESIWESVVDDSFISRKNSSITSHFRRVLSDDSLWRSRKHSEKNPSFKNLEIIHWNYLIISVFLYHDDYDTISHYL